MATKKSSYSRAASKVTRLRLTKSKPLNVLLVAVLLAGIVLAWYFLEYRTAPTAPPDTGSTASTYSEWSTPEAFDSALEKVDGLTPLDKKAEVVDYDRTAQFGSAWQYDYDNSSCDTRNDMLKISFEAAELDGNCKVVAGILRYDPYTGATNVKMSGSQISKGLDGEHVVALKDVWVSGAQYWDKKGTSGVKNDSVSDDPYERRQQVANDPLNVIMADSGENRSKGDKDATEWLVPENPEFRCEYITRQVEVKYKYGLGVTDAERGVMKKTLESCV